MKQFGLIGYPLIHSFSKQYFTQKFDREKIDACYHLYELSRIEEFPALCQTNQLNGLNVTIPYKEKILLYLHELDQIADSVKAVNVIKFLHTDGELRLKGYNTDVVGFTESIRPHIDFMKLNRWKNSTSSTPLKAIIFGTGGAAKAVKYGLESLGIDVDVVSRTKRNNTLEYKELSYDVFATHHILINATPLGTYPNINECIPIQFDGINENHLLFDVVYNPEETLFLRQGKNRGAHTVNGLQMLYKQAEAAWKIWNL